MKASGDTVIGGQGDRVMDFPEVMNLAEAAAYMRMGTRWLEDQVQAGVFPHNKLGRSLRFCRRHIDEYLDQQARGRI